MARPAETYQRGQDWKYRIVIRSEATFDFGRVGKEESTGREDY